jgi:hypothetical protein
MKFGHMLSHKVVLAALAITSISCGGKLKNKDEAPPAEATKEEDSAEQKPVDGLFELKADYKQLPLDILIIGDGTYPNGVADRLYASMPILASRIWNLATVVGSANVVVLDRYFAPPAPNATPVPNAITSTTPIVSTKSPELKILPAHTMTAAAFAEALEERVRQIGRRAGQPYNESVMVDALAEAAKGKDGNLPDFFRKDAYWLIINLSGQLNSGDPTGVDDVIAAFQEHRGKWNVSTLGIEEANCSVVNTNPIVQTNANNAKQRNSHIKLAKLTGGHIGSYCAQASFVLDMDTIMNKHTGTEYFPVDVKLPITEVKQILSGENENEVKDYRFTPGETIIEVSTKVRSGQKLKIIATVIGQPEKTVVSTDEGDKDVPTAKDRELSPEEKEFLEKVQPALSRACASCHNNNNRRYRSNAGYANAMTNRSVIAERMMLPTNDDLYMPQRNGTISAADKTAILDWATK